MFTLEDGREQLYQWDLNRRIIVNDDKICEVHFCNRTSDCSLVVETYTEDGKLYANIPNILLHDARPIRAYAFCDDSYTLSEQQFSVKSRTQPSDYVYVETDVVRWDKIAYDAEQAVTEALAAAESATKTAEDLQAYVDGNKLVIEDDGEGNVTFKVMSIFPNGEEVSY